MNRVLESQGVRRIREGLARIASGRMTSGSACLRRGGVGLLAWWALVVLCPPTAGSEVRRYPADAGVVDVTQAPYFARGDGITDDTEAIQQALLDHPAANKIIFLPKGTYLISATLRWPGSAQLEERQRATLLMGESRTETRLRLADFAPGFERAGRSQPMLWMGQAPAYHYRNAVRNLTLDTGRGNPGATGIQFMANSQGGVMDVDILAGEDGEGAVGLDLSHSDLIGPALIRRVRIHGFEYGIRAGYSLNGLTLEKIELVGQRVAGIRNSGQTLAIRELRSTNSVPALQNSVSSGMVTLVDAVCHETETRRRSSAVVSRGHLHVQGLVTRGYTNAIESRVDRRVNIPGPDVPLYVSADVIHGFPAPHRSLGLPVEETPDAPWDPLDQWAGPLAFGGLPNDGRNDSRAIQAAIDSGATTIYLPNGTWTLTEPVEFRGRARRLVGCEARLVLEGLQGQAAFRVVDGPEPTVWLEGLEVSGLNDVLVENASDRRLVLRSCYQAQFTLTGGGDLFLEDVTTRRPVSWKGNRVWARQWFVDVEGDKVTHEGGMFWALGWTGNRPGTMITTRSGGRTEILGGMFLASGAYKQQPMLKIENAEMTVAGVEVAAGGDAYQVAVQETRGSEIQRAAARAASGSIELPTQVGGVVLPLYSGFSAEDNQPVKPNPVAPPR